VLGHCRSDDLLQVSLSICPELSDEKGFPPTSPTIMFPSFPSPFGTPRTCSTLSRYHLTKGNVLGHCRSDDLLQVSLSICPELSDEKIGCFFDGTDLRTSTQGFPPTSPTIMFPSFPSPFGTPRTCSTLSDDLLQVSLSICPELSDEKIGCFFDGRSFPLVK
jgi:hypothetical protein